MECSAIFKFLRLSAVIFLTITGLQAFTAPQADDLVEIRQWMNTRNEASFGASENNKTGSLPPGTKAEIVQTKYFPQSQNYGVCLKTLDSSSGEPCSWVFYDSKNPSMELVSVHGSADARQAVIKHWMSAPKEKLSAKSSDSVKSPEDANVAITTRTVSSVAEEVAPAAAKIANIVTGTDVTAMMKGTVDTIKSLNDDVQKAMSPVPTCKECAARIKVYEKCDSNNDYLESKLESAKENAPLSQILASSEEGPINPSCIKVSMQNFAAAGAYRQCGGDGDVRKSPTIHKPCVSENYVDATAKSFNAVARCLSEYMTGSDDKGVGRVSSLSVFAMLNVESGFHVNAVSPTGAGGPGQFTQGAIRDVNRVLPAVKEFLSRSSDPVCNQALVKALEPPMNGAATQSCERINLSDNNPARNLIYTFAYQQLARKNVEKLVTGPAYDGIISDELPANYKESLISALMTWSHNSGVGGMSVPLRAKLADMLRKKQKIRTPDDVSNFLNSMVSYMKNYPHRDNSSEQRRKETSGYYPSFMTQLNAVLKQLPVGKVQSCLQK